MASVHETIICAGPLALDAKQLFDEARQKGANMDGLNLVVRAGEPTSWETEHTQKKLLEVKETLRGEILAAHDPNWEEISGNNNPTWVVNGLKAEDRHLHTFKGVVLFWRDRWNYPVSPAQKPKWYTSGIVQDLVGLYRGKYHLESVIMWDLGNPQTFLDREARGFKDVDPDTSTYLFAEERRRLQTERKVITHQSDLGFETYLITLHPEYALPTLFKAKGRF